MKIRPLKLPKRKNTDQQKPPRLKKKRINYIALIPSLITMMNGACGFMAIVFASQSPEQSIDFLFAQQYSMTPFSLAAYMVLLAMVADMLDGRIARITRTTSGFGGQLDSLSDAISFGVAPGLLMLKLIEYYLDFYVYESFIPKDVIGRVVFFSAIFYLMCAIVRLARFNVENEEDASSHMSFSGLPSPASAGVLVSLVIFHQHFMLNFPERLILMFTVYALPIIIFFIGILMISRIRYPHLANQLLKSKKTLPSLLLIFATVFFLIWNIQITLAVGFCGFALFGVFRWVFGGVFKRKVKSEKLPNT